MESNDEVCNINSLPNEMLINIFSLLSQNELVKIARVCRKWNVLTKSPVVWKDVDVVLHKKHQSRTTVAKRFVKTLPPCVTCIKLCFSQHQDCTEELNNYDFSNCNYWTDKFDFKELSLGLQTRCPHLKTLFLEQVRLSESLLSVIDLCTQFLEDVKTLGIHFSMFDDTSAESELCSDSKIEDLRVTWCQFDKVVFTKMPQLSVLDLSGSGIGSGTFEAIGNHGLNLKELYLSYTYVTNNDLKFISSLPHLEIICLFECPKMSSVSIVFLIKSCLSLQKVYVKSDRINESLAEYKFFVRN